MASAISPYGVIVTEVPKFDLQQYISNYTGRTVFRRLHLIASCSLALREEAAKLAVLEARRGQDLANFTAAVSLLSSLPNYRDTDNLLDTKWAVEQEKRNTVNAAKLENELKGYKNNLIKESIRMGNEDLGSHYYVTGDLSNALKAYSRMRDFCTTATQISNTAFKVVAIAIEQRNWLSVQSQLNRVKSLQFKPDEATRIMPKANAALGLQFMSSNEYASAAASFLNVEPTLGELFNDQMTPNDVATYGGLCALASMSRGELQARVLDNPNFRTFLELEPHIRRAISFFCASKYSQCLDILESYKPDYLLDLHLQPHVNEIYKRIRTKAIVQYFQPFSKVTLSSMQQMFATNQPSNVTTNGTSTLNDAFREELIALIQSGKLDARIDLESNTLIAKTSDSRAEMQKEALEAVDKFLQEAHLKIVRLNALNAGLEVKPDNKKKSQPTWANSGEWAQDDTYISSGGLQQMSGGGRALRSGR